MSRIYISQKTGKPVSHQCYQRHKNAANGFCMSHKSRPAIGLKGLCQECTEKLRTRKGVKKPHPPKSAWDTVEFSRSNVEIAAELNVTIRAVEVQREKRGVGFSKRRLNAAAYDMLVSLRDCLLLARIKFGNLDPDANIVFATAEAAIAKATSKP